MASMVLQPHIYQDSSLKKMKMKASALKSTSMNVLFDQQSIGQVSDVSPRTVTVLVCSLKRLSTINVGMNMMIIDQTWIDLVNEGNVR